MKSVMGGKVLEYEAKTILQEGMQEGLQKGMRMQARETAKNLHKLGLDDDTIAKMVSVNTALVKQWFAEEDET